MVDKQLGLALFVADSKNNTCCLHNGTHLALCVLVDLYCVHWLVCIDIKSYDAFV